MKRFLIVFSAILLAFSINSCQKEKENLPADAEVHSESKVSSSEENTKPEDEPTEKKISFLAVGDNVMHDSILADARKNAAISADTSIKNAGYDFTKPYENAKDDIKSADISFINHEAPVAGDEKGVQGYPIFNSPEIIGDFIEDLGFDIVNIANNHMLDMDGTYHKDGYKSSIEYWKGKNVLTVGGYESASDYENIRFIEKDGIKIAVLSYTEFVNQNANGSSEGCIVPLFDKAVMARHIKKAKEKCDLVFVSMHWGNENTFEITENQKYYAKFLADEGVDVIIGHHSHTIQPIEWIDGKDGNKTLCIYSLGNFVSTMLNSCNMLEGMVTFDIVKKDEDIHIENVKMTPLVCHYYGDASVHDNQDLYLRYNAKVYKLSEYTEELCKMHGSSLWGKFDLDTLKGYVTSTISKEFLD